MSNDGWGKLTRFLTTDPEIVGLKKRYRELTGYCLPGWNWNEYRDMKDYISYLRGMVDEAELHAERMQNGCFLLADPKIVNLTKRYYEITGRYPPGWDWRSGQIDYYVECLRKWVAEAEAAAQTDKEKIDF